MPPRNTRPADSNEIENLILAAFGKDEALEILPLVDGLLNAPEARNRQPIGHAWPYITS